MKIKNSIVLITDVNRDVGLISARSLHASGVSAMG